ncbi:MAG: hypothetical protein J1E84_05345 [Muribaculaceae bacterium]|nr:hypothetical protein [Muribaculaceae bacterium]
MIVLHKILQKAKCLPILLSLITLWSCQEDIYQGITESPGKVEFGGYLHRNASVVSRADGLDSAYITTDPFKMDFYIELNCEGSTPYVEYGTYVIPSGYEGQLWAKEGTDELNWHSLTDKHTFYSWNLTWDPASSNETDLTPWSADMEYDPHSAATIPVRFYNSEGENGYNQYRNNEYLENFVGAKTEPFVYKTHGKYVDMTYYHLASRINIANFILIENDGAIQENLKANITFINMPTEATFVPHPASGRPCITNPKSNEDVGLTYYIVNSPNPNDKDIFYVCPEIDFSKIDYKIQLTSDSYKEYDTYYGNFENVEFIRTEDWGYDKADGSDKKVLHAGEEMILNITLIPGKGPGLAVVISPWSTDKPTDSQYHTYPGIYTEAELNELRSLFLSLMSPDDEATLGKLAQLFDLYGVTEEDGTKYFMLYDNLTLTGNEANIFPVWKEYILNGLGHTITMKTNTGNYWDTGNKPYFNTGPVRDIYFTDPTGTYTIYIDKDGYVWVTNKETGKLEQTTNRLEDLNTKDNGKWNSYDINIETGEIRYSTYFNGHIVG